MPINHKPTVCNICQGRVEYISNDIIYQGKRYGSGYCYHCQSCGAYVGTYTQKPKLAMGILANQEMREFKRKCHRLFDSFWLPASAFSRERKKCYLRLASDLGIPVEDCHFGFFDLKMLKKAYHCLCGWVGVTIEYEKEIELLLLLRSAFESNDFSDFLLMVDDNVSYVKTGGLHVLDRSSSKIEFESKIQTEFDKIKTGSEPKFEWGIMNSETPLLKMSIDGPGGGTPEFFLILNSDGLVSEFNWVV